MPLTARNGLLPLHAKRGYELEDAMRMVSIIVSVDMGAGPDTSLNFRTHTVAGGIGVSF